VVLRNKLQVKFYGQADDHSKWGQKLDTIVWNCCQMSENAEAVIVDEQIIY
jgi:hypothetical protein